MTSHVMDALIDVGVRGAIFDKNENMPKNSVMCAEIVAHVKQNRFDKN
jgi:hypothetical protein